MPANRAWLIVALVLGVFLAAASAYGANASDFEGTYTGTVHTSSGADLGVYLWVKDTGGGVLDITANVGDYPGIPLTTKATWVGPNSFKISPSIKVPLLVSGAGTVTFSKSGASWTAQGQGKGTALGADGSASGSGQKVSDDFIAVNVAANAPVAATTAAAAGSGGQVPIAGLGPKQPPIAPTEKVAAALADDIAVLVGVLLCLAFGASMSGAEFADMWLEK